MSILEKSKAVWEGLARSDPYYAVCGDPRKWGGKWSAADLLATGVMEIETILSTVGSLGLEINSQGRALDFGCGVGRLSQALSKHFAEIYGVDISSEMVGKASELAKAIQNCRFQVNVAPNLSMFASDSFSFIYSNLVLQHMAASYVTAYLREFARVLSPAGILIFQVPDQRKGEWIQRLREHFKVRTRFRGLLSLFGVPTGPARGGWNMCCYTEQQVRSVLRSAYCKVVAVKLTNCCTPDYNGNLCFYDSEPKSGFVSKLYIVAKSGDIPDGK